MPSEGIPGYLTIRILDNNTGAEIIQDLSHSRDSTLQIRAPQPGMPGSSTIGTFTIRSPGGITSDRVRRDWQSQWMQLTIGQRMEAYLGGTGDVTVPIFSGIITGMKRPLDTVWEVTGVDSIWMLQQSQVLQGETVVLSGNAAITSALAFFGTEEAIWDDDFVNYNSGSIHPNSTDYSLVAGSWTLTANDPLFGLPALTATASGSTLLTKTTWNSNQQFLTAKVSIHGVIQAGTDTGFAGSAEVFILSDNTAANGLLVQVSLSQTGVGSNLYNVNLRIYSESGGVFTQQAASLAVFTNISNIFAYELVAEMGFQPTGISNQQTIFLRALINGRDANCVYTGFSPPASGAIGIRTSSAGGGSPQTWVNRVQFHARTSGIPGTSGFGTNRFQSTGTNFVGNSLTVSLPGNGQTYLDIIQLAASFDNVSLRKQPGSGFKSDIIVYGKTGQTTTGKDFSSSVIVEEGVNLSANNTLVATVAEMLSTDVRINALPGSDSGGSVTWGRIANAGDAVLTDTISDVGIPGFQLLVKYAEDIQNRKVNPLQAQQVNVIRDSRWLNANNGIGPIELDSVTLHIPSLGIYNQVVVIVGYDFQEGNANQLVYFSQLPVSATPNHNFQRIIRPIDFLTTTYVAR